MVSDDLLTSWNKATGNLSWGVQEVFRDAFQLVSDEKVTLVYGADYSNGSPCLVNSVASMLTTGGGYGVPTASFGRVVTLFDRINRELEREGVNPGDGKVSPLAADIFLRYFAPAQPKPEVIPQQTDKVTHNETYTAYVEPKDDAMAQDWLTSLQEEAAVEVDMPCVSEVEHGHSERR